MGSLDELNLGIETGGVSEAMLAQVPGASRDATQTVYDRDLLRRVGSLPGVSAAALSDFTPYWSGRNVEPVTAVEGDLGRGDLQAQTIAVSDGFFATLGIPLAAGEGFPAAGQEPVEPSAVISQSLAERMGGGQVIGKHIRAGDSEPYRQWKVIGIAGNAQLGLEDPADTRPLTVYTNLWQAEGSRRPLTLLVKGGAARELRGAVLAGGREYVQRLTGLAAQKDQALVENRWLAWISQAFGVLTLLLAGTGLFGLLSYQVAGRTGEIGLRMALGAERGAIRALVVRQIVPVMAAGMAGGIALAMALGRLLAGMVFGVSVYDPRLLGGCVVVLAVTALGAAWLPAHRAASIDPLAALRQD